MRIKLAQKKLLIKYLVDLSKIFWAGVLFSNIFLKKYFNLGITIFGIIVAVIFFVVAFIISKNEKEVM